MGEKEGKKLKMEKKHPGSLFHTYRGSTQPREGKRGREARGGYSLHFPSQRGSWLEGNIVVNSKSACKGLHSRSAAEAGLVLGLIQCLLSFFHIPGGSL